MAHSAPGSGKEVAKGWSVRASADGAAAHTGRSADEAIHWPGWDLRGLRTDRFRRPSRFVIQMTFVFRLGDDRQARGYRAPPNGPLPTARNMSSSASPACRDVDYWRDLRAGITPFEKPSDELPIEGVAGTG